MDMFSGDCHLDDAERGSIRSTWTISLNLLKERASKQDSSGDYYAAYPLLQLFAYFEPSDLRYNILRLGVIGNNVPHCFKTTFSSKAKFFGVIKILLELCLIDSNVSEGSFSMHRVVHDWLCTYVCGEPDRELLRLAVAAISYSAPLALTPRWAEEQQQLALHALHILAKLPGGYPADFLVQYDKMTTEELALVASLLDEPIKCWKSMKFNYTLIGISRLLQSCGRFREALKLTSEALVRCSETLEDGTASPIKVLLRYSEISCSSQSYHVLPIIAGEFLRFGSPSWAVKAQNLHALIFDSLSLRHEAMEMWEVVLDQSRNYTGSVFVHLTWMVFVNLDNRIGENMEHRRQLFEKFESDAKEEKDKLQSASMFLDEFQLIRRAIHTRTHLSSNLRN